MQISSSIFSRQFARFDKQIRAKSGVGFVSFREGVPEKEEGYKERLRNEALDRLDVRSWKRKEIGEGRILRNVIGAIEINLPRRKIRNNLVDWPNIHGHEQLSHRALLDATSNRNAKYGLEKWCFDFFKGSLADEEAFEAFGALAGNRYDIVAYLFFLRDWNRFMPIATVTFDKAFRLLDVDLTTSHHCSWQNYVSYNDALRGVRRALREVQGVRDARLIDAHSFCWMLIRLKPPPIPETIIPLPVSIRQTQEVTVKEVEIVEAGEFNSVDEEHFVERQARNHQLGRIAQDIALQSERKRVAKLGYADPEEVKPVWDEPMRGYDILSRESDCRERLIEVKAARQSGKRLSFFITPYEWRVSQKRPNYYFYLVLNAKSARPRVLMIRGSRVKLRYLHPANYLAAFAAAV